jgi:small Trp-rich protein
MYFLGIGLLMLTLKFLEFGPVAKLGWASDWYWFALPFALAVAWWAYADASGYTKRREMDKMEKRKQDRLSKNREALGIPNPKGKKR